MFAQAGPVQLARTPTGGILRATIDRPAHLIELGEKAAVSVVPGPVEPHASGMLRGDSAVHRQSGGVIPEAAFGLFGYIDDLFLDLVILLGIASAIRDDIVDQASTRGHREVMPPPSRLPFPTSE
ncbi:hypothetical protein DYB30_013896 [Aphanomyces astaci]|uniref:Uncharacterized protein n=2 Tax=Aphanomyces astaci TaxID=112090 RepID=A0A397ED72_APHAT|nr:hypothetical protein AaE_013078 [Aphanomyces astaci]RHY77218.1 hypothetical protein DYB30_013896 [Aphanomyces astaci]RHZ30619.1 hypothetical protein DYB26_015452 [Aphanomyces astaci]